MSTKQPDALRTAGRQMLSDAAEAAWALAPGASNELNAAIFAQVAAQLLDAAIARIEELEAELTTAVAGYDAARLEIASLQAQLEAVGAGGVSALMAAPAQPVAGQSRFKGDEKWGWCSHEHVTMVLATPSEWQGYEVRYLYASPQPPAQAQEYKIDALDRLRTDTARAIWGVMREYEDSCDLALEDLHSSHQAWLCADAAISAQQGGAA